jgi:N-carbamoyl-L-amino-acid hydrolase
VDGGGAAIARFVDAGRLWARHEALARHGATAAGGVDRQALSAEEIDARRTLIAMGAALGMAPWTDPAGNLFLRIEGTDPAAAPVLTGSHLDSQPTGGRFDGIYGVLAGLEAVAALRAAGVAPRRPVEVVSWMNEEGSRFAPGMMGSAAFAGAVPLERFLDVVDATGVRVRDALAQVGAAFPEVPGRPLGGPVHAYVEAHIEQGPVLERQGVPVGVVTGIQGKRTFRVTLRGAEAHAGTAGRAERRDALLAATAAIQALAAAMHDPEDLVRFTVGRLVVTPNVPSVVASRAVFSVDLRHPDSERLGALGDAVPAICALHAGPCELEVEELTRAASLAFPEPMRERIRAAARRCGHASIDLPSAAGHDARHLHAICPSAMIFVPCKDGISHSEAESARPEDLAAGARVLAEVLAGLASD